MPIAIKGNESKENFLSRCIKGEINAGKKTAQAAASYSHWKNRNKKK